MNLKRKDPNADNETDKAINIDYKKITLIIAVLLLIVFIIFSVVNIMVNSHNTKTKLNNSKIVVNTLSPEVLNKKAIKNYLMDSSDIENSILKNISKKNNSSNDFNNSSLDIQDYINILQKCSKGITEDLKDIKKMKCPSATSELNKLLINQYSSYLKGLQLEIEYMQTKNVSILENAQSQYNLFTELHEKSINEFKKMKSQFK